MQLISEAMGGLVFFPCLFGDELVVDGRWVGDSYGVTFEVDFLADQANGENVKPRREGLHGRGLWVVGCDEVFQAVDEDAAFGADDSRVGVARKSWTPSGAT